MKILVTGGAGFIGSNFIRYILDKYPEYKIINLDKLTYAGNLDNLKDIVNNPNYKFVKGDICDKSVVERTITGCDAVINFAAESHVDRSIVAPEDFVKTNFLGTYILLEFALKHKLKKFLHISTDEVYGSILKGAFRETDHLNPSSPYSSSKASADLLALSYFITHKLPVLITRSSNNFGPYQYPEKIIPLFITNLLERKKIPLYGDGKNIRDWLYVMDNCKAIDLVFHKGELGEIYNIASNYELENFVLTKKILELMGCNEKSIEYVNDRKGHDRRYSMNCGKIKSLGWKPDYNFNKAIELTVDWYKTHTKWWKKLK